MMIVSDVSSERRWCSERHILEYPQSPLDHQHEPMGAEDGAWVNEEEPTEQMGEESGPLENERNLQSEPLEDNR
jgi:hypothetical protein